MSDPEDGTSAEDQGDLDASNDGEAVKLRQENVRLRKNLGDAGQFVKFYNVLKDTQGGSEIIQRVLQGKPLTAGEKKTVKAAQEDVPPEDRVTLSGVKSLIQEGLQASAAEFSERVSVERSAERVGQQLEAWAQKTLKGFEVVRSSPRWDGIISAVHVAMNNGTMKAPEDPVEWNRIALKEAYNILLGSDPDLAKKQAEATKENKQAKESKKVAASQSSSSQDSGGGDGDEFSELPDEIREQARERVAAIRKMGSGTVGKRYASGARKN